MPTVKIYSRFHSTKNYNHEIVWMNLAGYACTECTYKYQNRDWQKYSYQQALVRNFKRFHENFYKEIFPNGTNVKENIMTIIDEAGSFETACERITAYLEAL